MTGTSVKSKTNTSWSDKTARCREIAFARPKNRGPPREKTRIFPLASFKIVCSPCVNSCSSPSRMALTLSLCTLVKRSIVSRLATKTPMETAIIRSTNTVRPITAYMIAADLGETRCARFKNPQSMMLSPTLKAMPDNTASGIMAVRSAIPIITMIKTRTRIKPERAVCAPA